MSAAPLVNRLFVLAARPKGVPTAANFRLVEEPVPALNDGQALVRNQFMSVDPAQRGRMNDAKSYTPPFQVDRPLEARATHGLCVPFSNGPSSLAH